MIDIQLLRQNLTKVAEKLSNRGYKLDIDNFQSLEQQRKQLQMRTEELQAQRNQFSKQIGALKSQGKHDEANLIMANVAKIKTQLDRKSVV